MSIGCPPFLLAHLSDLHATRPVPSRVRELAGKRFFGWLSWRRRRRFEHRDFVLEALLEDLPASGAEHIAITGDLTHIGLVSEVEEAANWLRRIGPPDRVSLVPGNHDAYGPSPAAVPWQSWTPYMTSRKDGDPDHAAQDEDDRGFPFIRTLGAVAIVGLSSALPTRPWLATGRLGEPQRGRLESMLGKLGAAGRFRVVLLHHPPVPAGQARRRQLDDAPELRAVIARTGAELVLHGHTHRTSIEALPGPEGPIPVVGVPSASSIGPTDARRARYHVYRIEPGSGRRARVSYQVRGYDPATGRFAPEGEAEL